MGTNRKGGCWNSFGALSTTLSMLISGVNYRLDGLCSIIIESHRPSNILLVVIYDPVRD